MRVRLIVAFALVSSGSAALAAERGYSVSDFDAVQVSGAYTVIVEINRAAAVRASGTAEALDRLNVTVSGRTLRIKPNVTTWGGSAARINSPIVVRVTAPMIKSAGLDGSGSLSIARMKAMQAALSLYGSGTVTVASVEADKIDLALSGSGTMQVAGKALGGAVRISGSGTLDAAKLTVSDLQLSAQTSGNVQIAATRSAKVTATGAGTVTITGTPACAVQNVGSGEVRCGK